jgi:transcription-repair coupling factor (superfamily II helicase)
MAGRDQSGNQCEYSRPSPDKLYPDTDLRLNLYRRLSNLKEETDLTGMAEEMKDRFGAPPRGSEEPPEGHVLEAASQEIAGPSPGCTQDGLTLTFSSDTPVKPETLVTLVKRDPRRYRFLSEQKLRVTLSTRTALGSAG